VSETHEDVRRFCVGPHGPFCTLLERSVHGDPAPTNAVGLKLGQERDAKGDFQHIVVLRGRPGIRDCRIPYCPFCGARLDGAEDVRIPGLDLSREVLTTLRALPFVVELGLVLRGSHYLNLSAPKVTNLAWIARAGAWSNDSIHGSSDERTSPRDAVLAALRARASACLRVAEDRDAEAKRLKLANRKAHAQAQAKTLRDEAATIRATHDRLAALWPESAKEGAA